MQTFSQMISGPSFKVVSDSTGNVVNAFHTREEAQAYADQAHDDLPEHHFQVVEVKWCGGSMRLKDLKKAV